MFRATITSLWSRLTRQLLGLVPIPVRPLRRRQPLEVIQLEDRLVPSAVGPGGSWNDGYTDSAGNYVAPTVMLSNGGQSWLEVSGGGGSVSVSPGAPPADGGGGLVPPPTPPPGNTNSSDYAFSVSSPLGPGSGDVVWSGSADRLEIQASGDVADIAIAGIVVINAGASVGNVSGLTVSVTAGTSVGNVAAVSDVSLVHATNGAVGTVTAGGDIDALFAFASLGAVSAGGDIGIVSANLGINGAVTADGSIGQVIVSGFAAASVMPGSMPPAPVQANIGGLVYGREPAASPRDTAGSQDAARLSSRLGYTVAPWAMR